MCVIAVKPMGVKNPDRDALSEMYFYNSDGAGFAYALNKRVYIEKGFMTFEDFERGVQNLEKKLKSKYNKTIQDVALMYHFRIGTHGPNSPELTHPFPITYEKKYLEALDLYSDVVMAHNGIINSVTPVTGWSDTTQYIKDILFPLYKYDKFFFEAPEIQELIENTINGSRFAFLDHNGKFTLLGTWHDSYNEDMKGIKLSNLNHENQYYYGYNYSSRWGCDTPSWANYTQGKTKKETIRVKLLPEDAMVLSDGDVDKDFTIVDIKSIDRVKNLSPLKVYVDDVGDIYYESENSKIITRSMYYTFAMFEGDDVSEYLTAKSNKLSGPILKKVYSKYTY